MPHLTLKIPKQAYRVVIDNILVKRRVLNVFDRVSENKDMMGYCHWYSYCEYPGFVYRQISTRIVSVDK